MKKSLISLLGGGLAALLCISGCVKVNDNVKPDPPVETTASVELAGAETVTAEIVIKVSNLTEYAYAVYGATETPVEDPAVLFATGTKGTLEDGENSVIIRGLEANQTYVAAIALKNETEYWAEVYKIEITTSDYVDTFTLIETYHDGFKAHFKVPQTVKDAGNAIRWSVGNLSNWYAQKLQGATDADFLTMNGGLYITNDTTFVFNNENTTVIDKDGDEVNIHDTFVPGEPVVFMFGEFEWGMSDFGWDEGYFVPLFDYEAWWELMGGGGGPGPLSADVDDELCVEEDKLWSGTHVRKIIRTTAPEKMEAGVTVGTEIGAVDGTITITPDDDVLQYTYWVTTGDIYQQVLDMYLFNDESLVQWYTTSVLGYYEGVQGGAGITEITLKDMFYEVESETEYLLFVTSMGDENGTVQNFQKFTFTTGAKTHPAPVVEVTPIANPSGTESPYEVCFNVKCTSKNAVSGKYAANYEREWQLMFNQGYSVADICAQGNALSEAEIAQINTEEGLNITFPSLAGQTNRLGIILYNDEDTANEKDAYAIATTVAEPAKAPVDSKYFTSLPGDWTMTSTFSDGKERTSKLSILSGYTYPATLDASVYEVYKNHGKEKAEVDELFEVFKDEIDIFNSWLKSQNFILCHGFGFERSDYSTELVPQDPYELFCSDSYSGLDCASMIWDCGPKWYLEVLSDGSVVAPVNANRFYPMVGYQTLAYASAYNKAAGFLTYNPYTGGDLELPVSVASDENTITVNPVNVRVQVDGVTQDVDFYLNAVKSSFGYNFIVGVNCEGPLVITRGWTESEAAAAPCNEGNVRVAPVAGSKLTSGTTSHRGRTNFGKVQKINRVTYNLVSFEEYQERLKEAYGRK